MEAPHTEIVQGVALEAISTPAPPDTESLLGQLGSVYPVLTYAAALGDEALPPDDDG